MGQTITAPATPQATPDTEAQDAKPTKKGKKGKGKAGEGKRSPLSILTAQQLKPFKDIDLSDEQTASLKEVITKHLPAVTAAKDKLRTLVTPDQRKQLFAAMKEARKTGLKPSEANSKALKALDLSEEATKSYLSAQAEVKTLNTKIRTELLTKLTDEQRAKIKPSKGKAGAKGKGKGKKKGGKKKKKAAEDADTME
jgi:Spy/CpxP family protein refolding chaperone